jgi:hypothetical protein
MNDALSKAKEALEKLTSLINYQYTGSAEAMTALQEADNLGQEALSALSNLSNVEQEPIAIWDSDGWATLINCDTLPDGTELYAHPIAPVAAQAAATMPEAWREALTLTEERLNEDAEMYDQLGHNSAAEDRRARAYEIKQMLAAHPIASGKDAKDAERYRFIRSIIYMTDEQRESVEVALSTVFPDEIGTPTDEQFDAAIDAALASSQQQKGGDDA